MLSRIADSLLWIGRYVERAEQTARILDVGLEAVAEGAEHPVEEHCRHVLGIVGLAALAPQACTPQDVVTLLATDADSPSSVAGALRAARDNARGARDVLTADTFETLNVLTRRAPVSDEPGHLHARLRSIGRGCLTFFGGIDAFMPRDEAWIFLRLGRLLERLDMTARLLRAAADPDGPMDASALLRSCGAHEPFLRRSRGQLEPREAVEFLLLDELCPRSAVHCLDRLGSAIDMLALLHGRPRRFGEREMTQRLIGQAMSSLRFRSLDVILADLPQEMADLQTAASAIGEAIDAAYLRPEG